jgi:hypothetical protein
MRRRALLAAVGAGCVAVGGCLGDGSDTPTDGGDPSDTTGSESAPASDTDIEISNDTDTTRSVTVTITDSGETIFEESVTLDAGEMRRLDPGPVPKGTGYELIAETETGRRDTLPFGVDDYDVREGSNLLVWISQEGLETGMQE